MSLSCFDVACVFFWKQCRTITRYNQSSYYAMAVLALGEAVKRQR